MWSSGLNSLWKLRRMYFLLPSSLSRSFHFPCLSPSLRSLLFLLLWLQLSCFPPPCKDPYDYIEPTHISQNNLSFSRSLICSHLKIHFACHENNNEWSLSSILDTQLLKPLESLQWRISPYINNMTIEWRA